MLGELVGRPERKPSYGWRNVGQFAAEQRSCGDYRHGDQSIDDGLAELGHGVLTPNIASSWASRMSMTGDP